MNNSQFAAKQSSERLKILTSFSASSAKPLQILRRRTASFGFGLDPSLLIALSSGLRVGLLFGGGPVNGVPVGGLPGGLLPSFSGGGLSLPLGRLVLSPNFTLPFLSQSPLNDLGLRGLPVGGFPVGGFLVGGLPVGGLPNFSGGGRLFPFCLFRRALVARSSSSSA